MSKISKKILFVFIALIFIFCITTNSYATDITPDGSEDTNDSTITEGTTSLEIVENNICTIDIKDLAKFEKKITSFNETEKSVTLTLSLTNLKTVEEKNMDVEIFLVIDNSASMTTSYVGDKSRKQAVLDSANSLVDKIYAQNSKVKVGIVGFSSLDTTAGETEGTINDATLISELSNNPSDTKNAITYLDFELLLFGICIMTSSCRNVAMLDLFKLVKQPFFLLNLFLSLYVAERYTKLPQ